MLLCGHQQDTEGAGIQTSEEVDWTAAAKQYNNLKEMPSFIAQQHQLDEHISAKKVSVDPSKLQGKQLEAFNVVISHCSSQDQQQPLKMIVSGTAGTGKSYLIWCLQELLGDQLRVTAPTGAAAYNVYGHMRTPCLAFLSEVTSETSKENVSTLSRKLLPVSDTSSWMRCQW